MIGSIHYWSDCVFRQFYLHICKWNGASTVFVTTPAFEYSFRVYTFCTNSQQKVVTRVWNGIVLHKYLKIIWYQHLNIFEYFCTNCTNWWRASCERRHGDLSIKLCTGFAASSALHHLHHLHHLHIFLPCIESFVWSSS